MVEAEGATASFGRDDDLTGAQFRNVDLTGARFVACDLVGVVMRSVDVGGLEIDAPWLVEAGDPLLVNGVDVTPLVDAELDRRFPGRSQRRAADPDGLRSAWAAVERQWAATLERVEAMPAGTVDVRVAGEWSFAQTLRHLVMATDTWLGRAILRQDQPYHPIGQPFTGAERYGLDLSLFTDADPSWDEVLRVRAGRVAMVRDHLAALAPEDLAEPRTSPWDPDQPETVLSCLHTVLEEEWEHHRYAVRDLDVLAAR